MRGTFVLAAVAVAVTALSGCASAEKAESGGATVATLASAAAAPSASAGTQRPRQRLDTTDEELQAMLGPYFTCMEEQGALAIRVVAEGKEKAKTPAELAKAQAADRICEPRYYPLPPWEKDPANPERGDFTRDVVKCLKNKGVKGAAIAEDGVSLSLDGARGLELASECEREVAAKAK
jgi:outer membrane murein-binding lipoprotein Lpp